MALGCWEGEGSGARRDREKTGPRLQEEASEGYTGARRQREGSKQHRRTGCTQRAWRKRKRAQMQKGKPQGTEFYSEPGL